MPFWYLNKKTDKADIFGSLPILSAFTGLNLNKLREHFSRKKETVFVDDNHRIEKLDIKTGGKNKSVF